MARRRGRPRRRDARAATSSGFAIQKRAITLSPSTANPGATVEIFGSGWGVKTNNNATSQVMITVTGSSASFGPFPVSSSGEFTGAFTVPSDVGVSKLTVTATDNNGTDPLSNGELTQGFTFRQPDGDEEAVGADGRSDGEPEHGLDGIDHHRHR